MENGMCMWDTLSVCECMSNLYLPFMRHMFESHHGRSHFYTFRAALFKSKWDFNFGIHNLDFKQMKENSWKEQDAKNKSSETVRNFIHYRCRRRTNAIQDNRTNFANCQSYFSWSVCLVMVIFVYFLVVQTTRSAHIRQRRLTIRSKRWKKWEKSLGAGIS